MVNDNKTLDSKSAIGTKTSKEIGRKHKELETLSRAETAVKLGLRQFKPL